MKLFIGLGNIGKQYEGTRHNIGFLSLDFFAAVNNFSEFHLESKFKAQISEGIVHGEKCILVKPTTFMNLSGESLALIKNFYKTPLEDIFIVYDDKDMEFGKIRIRDKGRDGGHNGIKSIIKNLGTEEFARIKIGVGDSSHPAYKDASAFVLGRFSEIEMKDLKEDVLPRVLEKIEEKIGK